MKRKKILLLLALLCAVVQGAWADPTLNQDGSGNYIIASAEDWHELCTDVSSSAPERYNNKTVKLTVDITVSEMVGTAEDRAFQGTFDGDGHTLTFNMGTAESAYNGYNLGTVPK